jgi:2-polyprenyl-6-methoxyphenol hydroxylase-like FAD-dependent oxidoreductase
MAGNSGQGLKVGIVGGSIAGFTAAIELQRIGCDVTLWERTGEESRELFNHTSCQLRSLPWMGFVTQLRED